MYRFVSAAFVGVAFMFLAAPSAQSQESLLKELYGAGVHAYFAQNYEDAHKHLSAAIDSGSSDPRCYYYRGMTYVQLGRPDEAQADFQQGATLELTSESLTRAIGSSLERIQGPWRLKLEETRRGARLAAQVEGEKARQARYDNQRAIDISGIDTSAPDVTDTEPLDFGADTTGGEEEPLAPVQVPTEEPGTEPGGDDLFGGGTAEPPATEPGGDDLFGGGTPEPPATTPPATDDDATDSRDPFDDGAAAPAVEPAPAKPAEAGTDDPFGDDPSQPAAPADGGDDLFGDATEPGPTADDSDDLFGEGSEKPAAPADDTDDLFGE